MVFPKKDGYVFPPEFLSQSLQIHPNHFLSYPNEFPNVTKLAILLISGEHAS